MSADPQVWQTEQLQQLVGGTITHAVLGDAGFPALLVRHPDGTERWVDVQSDPEGNGAGFLNIEKVEEEEPAEPTSLVLRTLLDMLSRTDWPPRRADLEKKIDAERARLARMAP